MANRRLKQRLAARGGATVLPSSFQVQPLEQIQKTTSSRTKVLPNLFNANLVANLVDRHQTVKQVTAIRKKSETSRQKKIDDTTKRQKSSTAQLQKRLALRQKAKQARALKKCKPFQTLSDQAHDQIVDVMNFEQMQEGTVLCTQGSVADQMYLLMSGQCSVQVDALHVATLYELDVFGEGALFGVEGVSEARTATVTAKEHVEVLILRRAALKALIRSNVLDERTVMKLKKVAEERKVHNEKLKQETNKKQTADTSTDR
jgi:CRP-like cAMP-binding protein